MVSVNDTKRILRALEVYYLGGIPLSEKKKQALGLWQKFGIKIFGLKVQRKKLYERINKRTENMFEQGVVNEVRGLLKLPLSITAQKIIGIEEIKGFLEARYSLDHARQLMSKNTRNLAKRQFTWFNKDKRIEWISIDELTAEEISQKIIENV